MSNRVIDINEAMAANDFHSQAYTPHELPSPGALMQSLHGNTEEDGGGESSQAQSHHQDQMNAATIANEII